MPRAKEVGARVLVGGIGIALVLFALWLSLISLLMGIEPVSPNPYIANGDPCCGYPDTWAEVRDGALLGWLWLGVALIPFVTGVLLLIGVIRGRLLRWRWLPIGVASLMTIAAVAIVRAYERLDEAPQVAHCRTVREQTRSYRAATRAERTTLSREISSCRVISGWTRAEVAALLGDPLRKTYPDSPVVVENWHYGHGLLKVQFAKYPAAPEPTVYWADPSR